MNIQEQANLCIAQGALTNSKRPSTFVEGVYPTHLVRGRACYVWDTAGKKYFDYICGLGSNLLGYGQQDICRAMMDRMHDGATLSLSTPIEIDVANRLKSIFPFVDCVKFLKTGTEACSAAVRIARAATGKEWILSEGYHGWSDIFVSQTSPALGVAEKFKIAPLGDWLQAEERLAKGNVAAIIIEPVMTNASPERAKSLNQLRALCTKYRTLLIFDEIITGFRFPKFSVANYFGIEPDLILLGKAIANGMPLSVVGGKKEIMNCDEYFVSSTFAGETLSLVAAQKTIDLLRNGQYKLDTLWHKGEEWLKEFNSLWPSELRIEGYATRGRFEGDPLAKALFFQEAVDSGLLFGPSWFFNFPLAEKSEITLSAVRDIVCKIKTGGVRLRGKMPQSPFAEKMRTKSSTTP